MLQTLVANLEASPVYFSGHVDSLVLWLSAGCPASTKLRSYLPSRDLLRQRQGISVSRSGSPADSYCLVNSEMAAIEARRWSGFLSPDFQRSVCSPFSVDNSSNLSLQVATTIPLIGKLILNSTPLAATLTGAGSGSQIESSAYQPTPKDIASLMTSISSGSVRPTPSDKVQSRARNLFVIAAAIIAYLFAGANIDQLTVLGLRAPASHPIVFKWAASVALVWFWWRYMVAWIDARSRHEFRQDFLKALRQTAWFQRHLLVNIDTDQILKSADEEGYLRNPEFFVDRIFIDGHKRLSAKIEQISLVDTSDESEPPTRYSISSNQMMDGKPILVAIPWWMHYSLGIPYFWWRAVRHEHFANQVLPHFVFITAVALICCKSLGYDPAGLFGILSVSSD